LYKTASTSECPDRSDKCILCFPALA
jgi:hypothetical protein